MFSKTKLNLIDKISNFLGIIFRLRSYVRILILVLLNFLIISFSLLISSVLLSINDLYYFSYYDFKLLYSLILFSIPIYFFTGQYKDLTRFIGSKSIYLIMIRNALLIFISYIAFLYPLSLGFVLWTFISSISYTLRIILRDILIYLNNKRNDESGILIYGAGAAGARLLNILNLENKYFVKGFIDDDSSLWGRSILGINIYSLRN